ncbi:MAG: hypothetical protein AB8V23_01385 [Candidatus Midichloria sp.]|uniref:Uncharacterized protein n=1 Tax=Hyalomma marginatum TaxID=34627 RepID=A0A8S4C0U5_9ACAR|nr:hypothetical protein MHYMCMPASI_00479 [Hyalomma marginatum]CAG7598636.1 hypothetical protein MHYMCMPSP_01140 [Hyalomma marginatum]
MYILAEGVREAAPSISDKKALQASWIEVFIQLYSPQEVSVCFLASRENALIHVIKLVEQ